MRHSRTRGQTMMIAVILFLVGSLIILAGIAITTLTDVRIGGGLRYADQSFYTGEGTVEDVTYRVKSRLPVASSLATSLVDSASVVSVNDLAGMKVIIATTTTLGRVRVSKVVLELGGDGVGFNYGLQVGNGGIDLANTASVRGNVFSNGAITSSNSGIVYGDIIAAGPTGLVDGITATGTVYAHTITGSTIGKDAYYVSLSGTSVAGTKHPGSPDQATSSLPITEAQVDEWEADAVAGTTITSPCPYNINSDITLGPAKINCDLSVTGTPTITLQGPVWVKGNISFSNSPIIKIDSGLSGQGVALIADNPTNLLTSSKISSSNSVTFLGAGTGSYILLLSRNNSAENGGSQVAIDLSNSVAGQLLVYAGHGIIQLSNSVSLKEVTAYQINAKNSAQVIYETGLANALFTSGPSGGLIIHSWEEK